MSADRNEVTRVLERIGRGEKHAANDLLPLIYKELRILAVRRLRGQPPGQTLNPTALVHEAYLRLIGDDVGDELLWDSRGHFYAAMAEAMRRILVDRARARLRQKRGGGRLRLEFELAIDSVVTESVSSDDLIDLDQALSQLAAVDADAAQLVKLRLFAGLSHGEAALAMGVARRTADRDWAFARAWLIDVLRSAGPAGE